MKGRKPISEQAKALLVEFVLEHPELTYKRISEILGISTVTVSIICRERGHRRKRPALTEDNFSALLPKTPVEKESQ